MGYEFLLEFRGGKFKVKLDPIYSQNQHESNGEFAW